MSTSLTVQSGPFTFSTKGELDAIRLDFKAKATSFNAGLSSASVNGQSFTFSYAGVEYRREEFAMLLQDAYLQLGISDYGAPPSATRVTRFC